MNAYARLLSNKSIQMEVIARCFFTHVHAQPLIMVDL